MIAAAYEDPLAQLVYPTLRHFAEAVDHWQHQLARPRTPEALAAGRRPAVPRSRGGPTAASSRRWTS